MNKYIEMTNKRFGKLLVIRKSNKRNSTRNQWWECLCDCGNTKDICGTSLRLGTTTSCGCAVKSQTRKELQSKKASKDGFHSASYKLYHRYRQGAAARGYIFELTLKEVQQLITQPCNYCGIESSIQIDVSLINEERVYNFNGIDRVDNTVGYVKGNVVSCCSICNKAKSTQTTISFLSWIDRISKHQSTKKPL